MSNFRWTLAHGNCKSYTSLEQCTESFTDLLQSWTYDTDCPSPIAGSSEVYEPTASRSSEQIDRSSWSAGYGNGAFQKNLSAIYTDEVSFAGIKVHKQAIGRPKQSCSSAKNPVTQGLVGLGYGQWPNGIHTCLPSKISSLTTIIANPPQNTFFTNLAPTLKMPVFTVSLNHRKPGFYDFGWIDERKYTGGLTWFPVPSNLPTPNLWGVDIHDFTFGSDKEAALRYEGIPAFIDSGGAFIFLPQTICDRYYSRAPNAKKAEVDVNHNGNEAPVYVYPCEETLPDLTIRIGTYKAKINGKLLQGAKFDGTCKWSTLCPLTKTHDADASRVHLKLDGQWTGRSHTCQCCLTRTPIPPNNVRGVQL